MIFKNKRAEAVSVLALIIAIIAVVGVIGVGINGKATEISSIKTEASDLAKECIVELYGSAAQLPKSGIQSISVDSTIAECVKARGQTVATGTCDPNSADSCSNTFSSASQDPDADPIEVSVDIFDSSGATTGNLFVTQSGQVLGSAVKACENCEGACKPIIGGNTICAICDCPGGPPKDLVLCEKSVVDGCRLKGLTGCQLGLCIEAGIVSQCTPFTGRVLACRITV